MKRIIGCIMVLVFLMGTSLAVACDKKKDPKCGDVKVDNKVNYHPKNDIKINNHPKTDVKNNIHNNTHNKVDVKNNVHNNVHVKTGDVNNKTYNKNHLEQGQKQQQAQNQDQDQNQDQSQSSVNNNTMNGGTQTTTVIAGGGQGGQGGQGGKAEANNSLVIEAADPYVGEHITTNPEETYSPAPNNDPGEEWNSGEVTPMKFSYVGASKETIEWVKNRCRFNTGFDRAKSDSLVTVKNVSSEDEYIGRCNVIAHFDYDIYDVQAALSVIGMNEGATKMRVVDTWSRTVVVTYSKNVGTRGGASILAGPIGEIAGHTGGGTNMGSGEVLKESEPGMEVEFYQ